MIKQICIEGLWLNILSEVDAQWIASSKGLARSLLLPIPEKPVPVWFLRSLLPDFWGSQQLLRRINKIKLLLIKAIFQQKQRYANLS